VGARAKPKAPVETGGGPAHLGGRERNLRPQEALQHLDDAAGGDALNNHLGQGKTHRLIGASAAVLRGRIEVAGTHLRHLKGQLPTRVSMVLGLKPLASSRRVTVRS
jgi:hypothetical protein